jgi:hypothetical protein
MTKSTQFDKPASPYFDHAKHGTIDRGIGADRSRGNAGGEVRPEKFINGPNSSRVTDGLGSGVPKKGHDA